MTRAKILAALLLVLAAAGALVWLFGPRPGVDATLSFEASAIGPEPVAYLAAEEAQVPDVTQDTAKEIVWAYPASRAKTPLAIVYVHGFSGDKRELRPVPDEVARRLGANLYFTRLSGHGRDLAALAEPNAGDWLDDFAEAVEIGRRIGERVVVMSTSTGGTLTAWAASLGMTDDVLGFVMVSPNFRLADWRAPLLTMPFAEDVVPFVTGGSVELQLAQPAPDGSRTAPFPIASLLPMAALVEEVRGIDFRAIGTPALFVTSPNDRIVDPATTQEVIAAWGGPVERLEIADSGDPYGHMLAGDMFSPETTDRLVDAVTAWIETLPGR